MDDAGLYLSVTHWSEFQHYRDRNPPWIKLYNSLLDDRDVMRLHDASKWLAVGILLLASRLDNRIPCDPAYLRNRLWLDTDPDLEPLISCGFITVSEDASTMLAGRTQDARPEREGETESERETEQSRCDERAREEPRGMDRLRDLLGDSAAALAAADIEILGSVTWPAAIVGMYGPHGTKRHTLRDLSDPDVSAVLAESVIAFAGERSDWHQPFFDSIVKRVADYRRNGGPEIDGMSEADRRLLQRRIEMESWDLNAEMNR